VRRCKASKPLSFSAEAEFPSLLNSSPLVPYAYGRSHPSPAVLGEKLNCEEGVMDMQRAVQM